MTTSKKKKTAKLAAKPKVPSTEFRFVDVAHQDLVRRASQKAGLSMNAWLVTLTLTHARQQLGEA